MIDLLSDVAWWHQASCRGATSYLDEFIPEPDGGVGGRRQPPPVVERLCSHCPVTEQCLQHGRITRSTGWFGGRWVSVGHVSKKRDRCKLPQVA
jgi:hypothetical protein